MILWIVTIGSSDVQLDSDKVNRDKGRTEQQRSDKAWRNWYDDEIQYECYTVNLEPKPLFKDLEESYRIAPRILGNVYQFTSDKVRKEMDNYLTFPLLSNFVKTLKNSQVPDAIAFILTDQSNIFKEDTHRRKPKCPYWQDTCELKPILENYFLQQFPGVELIPLFLSPLERPGLDDWDRVLNLVREKFAQIQLEPDTVYVSHQASTPAISSAVQFVSLAQFRTNVQFLVSNEDNQETRPISRSSYLGAIQIQEAKALLDRYDYAGVRDVLGLINITAHQPEIKRIKDLLDAAEQWNFAEFQKFKKIVVNRKLLSIKEFPWYQSGYESAYLAWVRFQQGSTVDALFHSFRAAEGSISKWAEKRFSSHIKQDPKHGTQLKISVCKELPGYVQALSESNRKNFEKWGTIGLFGVPLYELLKQARPQWQQHPHIRIVWEGAKDERNNLFHRIEGLQESELFEAWNTGTQEEWKQRLLGCLNFIAQDDLPEVFTSLEEASLMAKLHQELEVAINSYKP